MSGRFCADKKVWKSRLHSLFFRYDQESHEELVQHANVRQSDESGGALPEKPGEGKPLNGHK
jgi:hypothetical protein